MNDYRSYCPQRPCAIRNEHNKKGLCYSINAFEFLLSVNKDLIPFVIESTCGRMEVMDTMTLLSVPKECKIISNVVFIDKIYLKTVNVTSASDDQNELKVIDMQSQESSGLSVGDYSIGNKMLEYTNPEVDKVPDSITGDVGLGILFLLIAGILCILIYFCYCKKKM